MPANRSAKQRALAVSAKNRLLMHRPAELPPQPATGTMLMSLGKGALQCYVVQPLSIHYTATTSTQERLWRLPFLSNHTCAHRIDEASSAICAGCCSAQVTLRVAQLCSLRARFTAPRSVVRIAISTPASQLSGRPRACACTSAGAEDASVSFHWLYGSRCASSHGVA